MSKLFNVGKIVTTHGIKGEVKVIKMTDNEKRFKVGENLFLELDNNQIMSLTITKERQHKNHLLLQFEEITSLTEAEQLKGRLLKVKEEQLPPLPDNEFYIYEIINCDVYTTDEQYIGKITEVYKTGANDVWEITTEEGKEHLIPFIADVVKEVYPKDKKVIIELMEGLLE